VVKIEVKTSNNYNLTEGANVVLAFKNVRLISIYHLQRENHGSRKFETTYNLNGRSACTDRPQPPGSCSGLPECSSGLECISLHIVREKYCVINCRTDWLWKENVVQYNKPKQDLWNVMSVSLTDIGRGWFLRQPNMSHTKWTMLKWAWIRTCEMQHTNV
jgi:hypothetical protein